MSDRLPEVKTFEVEPEKKFFFELTDKAICDLVKGEIIFFPAWHPRYDFYGKFRNYPIEESTYQQTCKLLIKKCGYMVVEIIDNGVVLFPVNKYLFTKKVLMGASRQVISSGKIVKQY